MQLGSIRAKTFFVIFISITFAPSYVHSSGQNRCDLHDLIYCFLDNGVMTTPKRQILLFVFTILQYILQLKMELK